MSESRHGPPDASQAPRFTGIRSFARCPHRREPQGADVAIVGLPFDTATSNRPGARFGPAAIRDCSIGLRPFNPGLNVNVFESLSVIDWGDADTTPGNAQRTAAQIAEQLEPLARAGTTTICLGGDHSVVLGELRALAAVHGPMALLLLDSHTDTWDHYYGERYFHGTPFRRAVEEGLLLPQRSLMAGMRGSLYSPADWAETRGLGFELMVGRDLAAITPKEFATAVQVRAGDSPIFLSFDIDFVDPAFAPGTGTPEVGGPSSADALALLRALAGTKFCGFDLVEVSPPYDGAAQTTALLAANVAFEMLSLAAIAKRDG